MDREVDALWYRQLWLSACRAGLRAPLLTASGSASDSAALTLDLWINSFAPKLTEESVHLLYHNAKTLLNGGVLSSREVKLGGENVARGLVSATN
ncbi:MAG TPA: hypothetical protein DD438_06740 [Verrucomicrobiales bacterium]|nr:hypothetical protein [Verrucomicrobiales bacterium]|tara:strand:- start:133 stop:417 length:285 start_codon:yes stop_codon:yes gene_type:complete